MMFIMGKTCFDCGKKLSFVDAKVGLKRLRSLGYSDKIITRMNNDDVVCTDCSAKLAQKEVDLKLEATIRSNSNPTLPSHKHTLPSKKSTTKKKDVLPTSTTNVPQPETNVPQPETKLDGKTLNEKIVIIRGSWNTQGKSWKQDHLDAESKSGLHHTGDLQQRYAQFANTHEIIDVQPVHQSVGHEIVLMVRYKG